MSRHSNVLGANHGSNNFVPLPICRFPHAESADIFAFLDYIQKFEDEEKKVWKAKSAALRKRVQRKKQKAKAMYRKKYASHIKRLQDKYEKKRSKLQLSHEKSIRRTFLMGGVDNTFAMEEWKEKQKKNNS